MPFTVFYAWQMDTPTKLNRWFIEGAIKTAIRKMRTEFRQETATDLKLDPALAFEGEQASEVETDPDDSEIVYQWGAIGHVGASLVAETILRRIQSCGVFIADVSFTAQLRTADTRTKKIPNANVLIEVGAACRTGAGWDRMILVMNTAFGRVDELPFDLRHRQCQVTYTLQDSNEKELKKKAETLAKDFARQLRPMYLAYRRSGSKGGFPFFHSALEPLHALYVSFERSLEAWHEVDQLPLDDRNKQWATQFYDQFADLVFAVGDAVGAQARKGISEHLSSLSRDIRNATATFDHRDADATKAIADAAMEFVSNYVEFAKSVGNHGIRLNPGPT